MLDKPYTVTQWYPRDVLQAQLRIQALKEMRKHQEENEFVSQEDYDLINNLVVRDMYVLTQIIENKRPIQIELTLLQQLIDASYNLAVNAHYEDVLPIDAEQSLIQVLCMFKEHHEIEPTSYGDYDDPHHLLGEPLKGEVVMPSKNEPQSRDTHPTIPPLADCIFTEASILPSDGTHYTIEGRDLTRQQTVWERVEASWECPTHFPNSQKAEDAARTLALRSEGDRVYRVVNPIGSVQHTFHVKKYLSITHQDERAWELEAIPIGFCVPLLSEVLTNPEARAKILFPLVEKEPSL